MPWRAVAILCLVGMSLACRSESADTTAAGGTVLAVGESPDIGRYLTDAEGRPLYVRPADGQSASTCYDECADSWRAVPGSTPPPQTAEPAIQFELIGALARTDGTLQVSYAGRPLYYAVDGAPLRRSVTDQWGVWSLVFPHGEPMVTPP